MDFRIFNLGLIDYEEAWKFQWKIFNEIKNDYLNGALILCRHYPVITIGRQGSQENIRIQPAELKKRGIQMYNIERGGDVTYHGPGQLIAYPVLNLNYFKKDIHFYLRQLEELVIDFLSDFGINALKLKGLTGVWICKEKIASIGIAIRNWITFHGVSINIKKNDLDNFSLIRPCGMDIKMISLETILRKDIDIESTAGAFINKFKDRLLTSQAKEVILYD